MALTYAFGCQASGKVALHLDGMLLTGEPILATNFGKVNL
jgi:hypothetical protein